MSQGAGDRAQFTPKDHPGFYTLTRGPLAPRGRTWGVEWAPHQEFCGWAEAERSVRRTRDVSLKFRKVPTGERTLEPSEQG